MRQLSNALNTLITQKNIKYFFLVSLDIEGIAKHYTSLPYNITMSNGITYLSDGGLYHIDPPRISDVVDREAYKITFADSNFDLKYYFEQGVIGKEMVVYIGLINVSDYPIIDSAGNSISVGETFKDMRDTIIIYKGAIDSHGYSVDIQNEEVHATIEGSSPMADLDLVKSFYTSKDSITQKNSQDTSFDKVHEGSGAINVKWGKIS